MLDVGRSCVIRMGHARKQVPGPAGERGVNLVQRGTLSLRLNVLLPPNASAAHELDELYIVLEGRGVFVHGDRRESFERGDILFIAAGVEHHFEDFEELTLWRIYYGPTGGELPLAGAGDRRESCPTSMKL